MVFLGRMTGIKDFFNSFKFSSEILAEKTEILIEKLPDKKIIMVGLSNGGDLVIKAYKEISDENKNSVFGISLGRPFWAENFQSENILNLNNQGEDSLVRGSGKDLITGLTKAISQWLLSKLRGENLPFARAIVVPGHQYSWPEVEPEIRSFLESRLTR